MSNAYCWSTSFSVIIWNYIKFLLKSNPAITESVFSVGFVGIADLVREKWPLKQQINATHLIIHFRFSFRTETVNFTRWWMSFFMSWSVRDLIDHIRQRHHLSVGTDCRCPPRVNTEPTNWIWNLHVLDQQIQINSIWLMDERFAESNQIEILLCGRFYYCFEDVREIVLKSKAKN